MIKLVYLEFRLGVQFSCSCVKREDTQLQFDNKPWSKRSSIAVFLKMDFKTWIRVQNENFGIWVCRA
jgi:hypothetical protein